jgi:hypothetical protein
MTTQFSGSEGDDAILEVQQNGGAVSLYIYYPGEQSVGSRIHFDRTDMPKVIDNLHTLVDNFQDA